MKHLSNKEEKHALLSASSSHRWLACTPSARLEESYPSGSSVFAEEGTLAHLIGELKIRSRVLNEFSEDELEANIASINNVPDDMLAATDIYSGIVAELFNAAIAETPDSQLLLEQKLDYSDYAPDGFGTSDCTIVSDECLHVIDYKHGKGIPVSAINNPQTRLYALGAYAELGSFYNFKKIRMTIVQPRLDNITTEEMSLEDLLVWGETVCKPKAALAYEGKGEFCPGEHCRFCRAAGLCRARADAIMDMVRADFAAPPILTDEEVLELIGKTKAIKAWCDDINTYALSRALDGHHWDGFRLVESTTRRTISDAPACISKLVASGYGMGEITETKLLGITKLEKVVGKKNFSSIVGDLVYEPKGEPVLAPEDDKRKDYNNTPDAVFSVEE